MADTLRIGTRGSSLALAQARLVAGELRRLLPDLDTSLVEIRTSGDQLATASLAQVGGKGLFIRELEAALKNGEIDLAVHSLKDLPAQLSDEFRLAAVPRREDTRDVLVTRDGSTLTALPAGARVGTSSLRRRFEAARANAQISIVPMRGNVDTRLRKVADHEVDAIIVALAGLKRLGRAATVKLQVLDQRDFIPAGGQGALAIEALRDGPRVRARDFETALEALNDPESRYETAAERAFLASIGASCATPVGVRASVADAIFSVRALLFSPDGSRVLADAVEMPVEFKLRSEMAAACGEKLARQMLARGAAELIGG